MEEKDDRYTRITFRIPKDLHKKLQTTADLKSRSMNAEIIDRLEKSFTVGDLVQGLQDAEADRDRKHRIWMEAFRGIAAAPPSEELNDFAWERLNEAVKAKNLYQSIFLELLQHKG